MVKRVLITKDLGEHKLPKWISWLKVVVDGTILPSGVAILCTDLMSSR